MLAITRRDLDDAYASMRDAHSYIQRASGKGETVTGQVVETLGVVAGALGVGVASGRFGALQLAGSPIPLDLAGGLLGHGLAFFGLAGKYSENLHDFSNGVLAGYATKWGIGFGTEMRRKSGLPPVMTVAGETMTSPNRGGMPDQFGCAGAEPLTEAELAAMSHAVR